MISICFFAGDITRGGGSERAAIAIANSLCCTGEYKISLLSLVEQRREPFFSISPEIERFVLKKDHKWVKPGISCLMFIPALRRFLKTRGIEIIIDVDLVLDILSLPASVRLPVKVISWEHFNYLYERGIGYRKIIMWFSVRFSDCIVTLTERDRQNYRMMTCRKDRLVSINNPADLPANMTEPKEKMLITVGQLNYRKGTDLLTRIIPGILKKYREWKWYFLGDGEYMKMLENIRDYYGLKDQLILTGVVANVKEYLMRAAVMVMGSREEGLPMCLLEAKSCQVPCIAFDIPAGPLELIADGVNGFLIAPFDLRDMTGKIARLIEDSALREEFMRNSVTGMEKYQIDTVREKWIQLLNTVSKKNI